MSRAFKPTAEQRESVELMISYGAPETEICLLIKNPETGKPIEVQTLREHFASEIATGTTKLKSLFGNRFVAAMLGRDRGLTDKLTQAKLLMLFAEHRMAGRRSWPTRTQTRIATGLSSRSVKPAANSSCVCCDLLRWPLIAGTLIVGLGGYGQVTTIVGYSLSSAS
jgi:hypothetical protein